MKPANRARNILVVSQDPKLADIVRKAVEETIIVDYAANEAAGSGKPFSTRRLFPRGSFPEEEPGPGGGSAIPGGDVFHPG